MPVSDVYAVHIDMEMPSGAASMNFHYQETTPPSSLSGPQSLAQGIVEQQFELIKDCISDETAVTQCRVYKKAVVKEVPFKATITDGHGDVASPPLPSLNGAKIGLGQMLFNAKSNGLVWLPGIPAAQVTTSNILTAFLEGPIKVWTDRMLVGVEEPAAGDGRFRLVVVSRKFLLANPGDYVGAAADVTEITRFPIIGRQNRRRTKVRGGADVAIQ